jgi:(2Fe-2S) ferredoxin
VNGRNCHAFGPRAQADRAILFDVAPRHLLVCTNARGSGKPTCGVDGTRLVSLVTHALVARRATDVLVTATACLGPCFDGPNAVVYPDGVWYAGLDDGDVVAIVNHLVDGVVLESKRSDRPGS